MNVVMDQAENINLDNWSLPGYGMQRQSWGVPPKDTWRVENKFRQTNARSKTSTLFKRFNGHYIAVQSHRRKKELPEQIIDLTFVEPQPREVKDYRYTLWFVATCLLTIPAIVYSLVPFSPLWLGVPVITALILMVAAVRLRRHHFDFLALNSDVVLFRVDALASDQARVGAFLETVCAGISLGQRDLPEGKQRVPLAVAEMRRLHKEGVITGAQYEIIKKNWFAL
ncbi:hypothetical protein ACFOZ5_07445 [Marinobacter lacisalsi]|uniref:SHOCT domain-containing protein n=1 Tax=Marinobacter lacisalsi TaxID=475979 RepID=A0ABV8QGV1_9GAMM